MGIYPAPFLKPMEPAVAQLISRYEAALAAAQSDASVDVADTDPAGLPVFLHLTAGAAHD
jgi:hypothetical protein